MRVIAGTARRMRLVTPDGMDTRPTQDIIKETLFNILMPYIPGSVFLDLCAGSGQIGIEALSRGAKKAYFVESGRAAASCIQKNLHTTHFEETGILLRQDAVGALRHIHEKEVDLIYMDPPYESDTALRLLSALAQQPYVTEDTIIIIETSLDSDLESAADMGFEIYREKDYRTNRHLFLRRSAAAEEHTDTTGGEL
ncbi:MAG: 16S rRNA (guanine(966)-N(2))-methyltransferase RsmD [Lachnospiraceae bacterium]|nr:16S rRNA (guanine(966)-N(2))-methyltransferase RsmD [Lachnospiraceae bacterium]